MQSLIGPLFAFEPASVVWVIIPVLALMIPILKMLIRHQQYMAELVHGSQRQGNAQDVAALHDDVKKLREQMAQFALALDDVKQALPRNEVRDRINETKA